MGPESRGCEESQLHGKAHLLLAQMYNWTNDTIYRNELNYKLDKNLLPSVLMDADTDGLVDGTNPAIAFQDLTLTAQTPGRNWDGHNSLPWYNAMNAWAITDAYVAFRDRGDIQRAQELKPYVLAMLDNLSWEINNLGIIDDQLGVRDLTYALLNGIWKVARYENESHPEWETAAWAMWNSGYFDVYSTHSVCVELYLCILTDTPYEPPFVREFFASIDENTMASVRLFPNPAENEIRVKLESNEIYTVEIYDLNGRKVLSKENVQNSDQLNVSKLESALINVY
ncbi:MAG: hypothetical protein DCO96_02610 [Fluviicola sp. XM-24bin1]|nr:MAG: hypothetical protein DCO96_02610 [Fluviicola sp. XM-24bin1]